jgi:Zn-dependent peptidase ImmA (M78 family)/DNA-binding XRE family transcriptional regulator
MDIGPRLKMARRMAGLSQRALAEKVGLSHAAISKYERGEDAPSSPVLLRLVEALGVGPDFVLRASEVTLTAPAYRHHTRLGAKAKTALEARIQDRVERFLEAESLFPERQRPGRRAGLPERRVRSLAAVERAAEALRDAWRLGRDAIPNLTELLEERGVKVIAVEGLEGFDAVTFWADDERPVIAVSSDVPGDRQRFNLGHELGHLVMKVSGDLDEEPAAHRFAGAFLVPRETALAVLGPHRGGFTVRELELLKGEFGLSMQAWIHRAADLGVISGALAARWYRAFRQHGWHREEPGEPCPQERPTRMERLVMQALAEEAISESRAAELLDATVADVRAKARRVGDVAAQPAGC